MSAAIEDAARTAMAPPPELSGDHSLYRLVDRMRSALAAAPVRDRGRVLIALVRLEMGEGVAAALERRCP